jgi:hypothetical protein
MDPTGENPFWGVEATGSVGYASLSELRGLDPELDYAISDLIDRFGRDEYSDEDPEMQRIVLQHIEDFYTYYLNGGRESGMPNPRITLFDDEGMGEVSDSTLDGNLDAELAALFDIGLSSDGRYERGQEPGNYADNYDFDWEALMLRAGQYDGRKAIDHYGGIENIPPGHPFWESFEWRKTATYDYFTNKLESDPDSIVFATPQGYDFLVLDERYAYQLELHAYFDEAEAIVDDDDLDAWLKANPMPEPPPLRLTNEEMFALERLQRYDRAGAFDGQTTMQPQDLRREDFPSNAAYADAVALMSDDHIRSAMGLDPYEPEGPGLWWTPFKIVFGATLGAVMAVQGIWDHTVQGLYDPERWAESWEESYEQLTDPVGTLKQMRDAFMDDPVAFVAILGGGMLVGAGVTRLLAPAKAWAFNSLVTTSPRVQAAVGSIQTASNARLVRIMAWANHPDQSWATAAGRMNSGFDPSPAVAALIRAINPHWNDGEAGSLLPGDLSDGMNTTLNIDEALDSMGLARATGGIHDDVLKAKEVTPRQWQNQGKLYKYDVPVLGADGDVTMVAMYRWMGHDGSTVPPPFNPVRNKYELKTPKTDPPGFDVDLTDGTGTTNELTAYAHIQKEYGVRPEDFTPTKMGITPDGRPIMTEGTYTAPNGTFYKIALDFPHGEDAPAFPHMNLDIKKLNGTKTEAHLQLDAVSASRPAPSELFSTLPGGK